jgi:murein L,D-transpeptidase YafK
VSKTAGWRWRWFAAGGIALIAALIATLAVLVPPGPGNLAEIRRHRLDGVRTELAAKGLQLGRPIFIRIFKEEHELELWVKSGLQYELFKTFPICKWSGALGPKQREGDWQSPEGFYSVSRSQMNPNSQYHLSFNLGFPNAYDQAQGRTGTFLMVHGACVSVGCYAMTNEGIEEIWLIADEALKAGHASFDVHAFPFRPTPEALAQHQTSPWHAFWANLAVGYEKFEVTRVPPVVSVANGAYVIN